MIANCGVTIRTCRCLLARHIREPDEHAGFEGVIADARKTRTEIQKEL